MVVCFSLCVCSFASFADAKDIKFDPKKDACADLFDAACLNEKGQLFQQGVEQKTSDEIKKTIAESRDKAAKSLGYDDYDAGIKKVLKENDIELIGQIDQENFEKLKGIGINTETEISSPENLFTVSAQCKSDSAKFKDMDNNFTKKKNKEKALKIFNELESFEQRHKKQTIKFHAKNISSYVNDVLLANCRSFDSLIEKQKNKDKSEDAEEQKVDYLALNPQWAKICNNRRQIKREAIDLFRAEGEDDYKVRAEKFVEDNWIPTFETENPPKSNGGVSQSDLMLHKIDGKLSHVSEVCEELNGAVIRAAQKVIFEYTEKVTQSKAMVESLITSVYTDERKKTASEIFNTARDIAKDIVNEIVQDGQKKNTLLEDYDRFKLNWLERPSDSAYLEKEGQKYLDLENYETNDEIRSAFAEPSLPKFNTINAHYEPSTLIGRTQSDSNVHLYPGTLVAFGSNPFAISQAIAHEVGHKLGTEISRVNRTPMKEEFKYLLACYKDPKSIKLLDKQEDEVIADYVSAEILARQLAALPKEKRRSTLLNSMQLLCSADDHTFIDNSFDCASEHPEPYLRISGIIGANPNLRETIGCSGSAKKFKTCGLNIGASNKNKSNAPAQQPTNNATEKIGVTK
jgi:hypothetical protein